jgi:cbb3-type cytochrome oxidase subunit 3
MFTGIFTLVAIAATYWLLRLADRANVEDRAARTHYFEDDEVRQSVVHARQDLKLIAFLLMGIMIMLAVGLGVIADRIH